MSPPPGLLRPVRPTGLTGARRLLTHPSRQAAPTYARHADARRAPAGDARPDAVLRSGVCHGACLRTHRANPYATGAPPDYGDHPCQRFWPAAPCTFTAFTPTTIFFMVNDGRAIDLRSEATLLVPLRTRYAAVTAPAEEKARCRAGGSAPIIPSRSSSWSATGRAMGLRSIRVSLFSQHGPSAQRVSFVPPCWELTRNSQRARHIPAFLHKSLSLCSVIPNRNAVFNGRFTATAKEP